MIGFVSGLSFTIFLGVGASLTKVHLGSLPSPIDGCHLNSDVITLNGTIIAGNYSTFSLDMNEGGLCFHQFLSWKTL